MKRNCSREAGFCYNSSVSTERSRRSLFLIIGLLTISVVSGATSVFLVPALLVELSREFGITVAVVAQMNSISGLVWALTAFLGSPLANRYGYKRMALLGFVISIAAMLGYSASRNLAMLLGFSVLTGLGGALVIVNSLAAVSDYTSVEARGRAISIVSAGVPIASLGSAPIGAWVADIAGWRWSFLGLAMLMVLLILLISLLLPGTRPKYTRNTAYLTSFRNALQYKPFIPLMTANVLMQAVYHGIYIYLPAFLIQSYALTTGQIAPFLTLFGGIWLAGTIAGGPISDRVNKLKICTFLPIPIGIGALMFMLITPGVWLSMLIAAFFLFLYGVHRTALFSFLVSLPDNIRSLAVGTQSAGNHGARSIGGAGGGLILAMLDYSFLGVYVMTLATAGAGLFGYVYFKKLDTPEPAEQQ